MGMGIRTTMMMMMMIMVMVKIVLLYFRLDRGSIMVNNVCQAEAEAVCRAP